MKKKKRWIWILVIILILLAIIGFILIRSASNSDSRYAEETVRSGSIETYYSFSGNLAVRNNQALAAKVNATIREIYVAQDQAIEVGDPLMRLSNGDIIKADIAGEITEIHVSEGDTVGIGTALLDIVDFDDLQVLIKVDEFDVGAVTVGKEAKVTIDALGMVYDATVEHISKTALSTATSTTSGGDVNYYEAKLTAPQDERILPGMKVDVRILNESAEDTLLLPMSALQFDAYNNPFVYMRNSAGDVVEVAVGVGIQDGTMVEITDGLRVSDTVLIPQASSSLFSMMPGSR